MGIAGENHGFAEYSRSVGFNIREKIQEVSRTLPDGLKLSVSFDRATYIKEAIQMCYQSIILAFAHSVGGAQSPRARASVRKWNREQEQPGLIPFPFASKALRNPGSCCVLEPYREAVHPKMI